MTVRLQASLQSLVFVVLLAATLFGAAGRINFIEFWLYVAIVAVVSGLALAVLDPDLMQERMRPGWPSLGSAFAERNGSAFQGHASTRLVKYQGTRLESWFLS